MNLQEATIEQTRMAHDPDSRESDKEVRVRFFMQPKQNKAKSKEAGRPIFEDREYITIFTPGNKDNIPVRPVTDIERRRFHDQYQAWLKHRDNEEVVEGTPLSHWPGVTRSQVAELAYFNVRTVEELAAMSDSNAQGFMGIQLLRDRAKAYLKASETEAAAEQLRQAAKEREELHSTIEALTARIAAMEDEKAKAPAKRGRGRPRNDEEAA